MAAEKLIHTMQIRRATTMTLPCDLAASETCRGLILIMSLPSRQFGAS